MTLARFGKMPTTAVPDLLVQALEQLGDLRVPGGHGLHEIGYAKSGDTTRGRARLWAFGSS
jgi:hypothetical protein